MERETKGERHSKNVCLGKKRRKRLDSGEFLAEVKAYAGLSD